MFTITLLKNQNLKKPSNGLQIKQPPPPPPLSPPSLHPTSPPHKNSTISFKTPSPLFLPLTRSIKRRPFRDLFHCCGFGSQSLALFYLLPLGGFFFFFFLRHDANPLPANFQKSTTSAPASLFVHLKGTDFFIVHYRNDAIFKLSCSEYCFKKNWGRVFG